MKYNYKITKPMVYTLLVLGIFGFSKYPESCAKYATYDATALTLNAGQYKLEKTNVLTISPDFSEPKTIEKPKFILSFPRNQEVGSFKQDIYTLGLPKTCEIYGDISTSTTSTKNKTNKTITFNHSNSDTVVLKIRCDIDQVITGTGDARKFDFQVEIKEHFVSLSGDTEQKFTYTSTRYNNTTYAEYASKFEIVQPVESNKKTIRKNDPNAYDIFTKWLEAYYKDDVSNKTKVLDYVQKYCKSSDEVFTLAGLDVIYDEKTDSYTYTIGNNFTKYANLYYLGSSGMFEYFLPSDDIELENAFEFYLKNDLYKDDEESVNKIVSYVKSVSNNNRGIGSMILPDKETNELQEIPGLIIDENKPQAISVAEDILDYAFNKENGVIRMPFRDAVDMMTLFIKSIPIVYEESEISETLTQDIQAIYKNIGLLQATYKNAIGETPKAFNYYYMLYDEENKTNVLIRIYSNVSTAVDGTVSDPYTYAEILKLDSASIPGNKTIRISTKEEDKPELLKIVEALDIKYNVNPKTTVTDSNIIKDSTTGIIIYDYKTPKILSTPDSITDSQKPGAVETPIESEITSKPTNSTKPSTDTVNKNEQNSTEKVEEDTTVKDTPEQPLPTEKPADIITVEKPQAPTEEEKKEEMPVATEPPKEELPSDEPVVTPKPTEELNEEEILKDKIPEEEQTNEGNVAIEETKTEE